MSRVAKAPVTLPKGVEATLQKSTLQIKGAKGVLELEVHNSVDIRQENNVLRFASRDQGKQSRALAGTFRALVSNMVVGVTQGFEKNLVLQGVGYRAKSSGNSINLQLGYSHPIDYSLPKGITVETPTQTEIIVRGVDKQRVGQVAAEIRAFRPPEPYKGKGVRYADENVRRKEAKKK